LPFAQVHVSSFPADESFVNLYLAAHLATEYIVLQGETNAVKHEPCGFLGNAQIAGEFAGANAALAVGQHPERGEPFIKANSGIFGETADLDGELALGMMLRAFQVLRVGLNALTFSEPQIGQITPLGQRFAAR